VFGLKLRDEFLTAAMQETAVALHRADKTGALDIPSEDFFKITYPSIDLQKALHELGKQKKEGRPIVLLGERGRGKSHLMAAMHHALLDSEAAEKWANYWVHRGVGEQLKDLHFPRGYNLITIGLNEHEYKTLWEPLFTFERPDVGQRYKGRFEVLQQNVPPKALIIEMLKEQPVALFLDELQGWYESTTNSESDSGPKYRAWAFSFLQILASIQAQGLRDYLRILALIYRVSGNSELPLITSADFTVDEVKNAAVQELLDSVSPPEQRRFYDIAVNNLKAVQEAGVLVPRLSQIMGSLWMRSFSIALQTGTTEHQLHLDLTHDQKIDDNEFKDQLVQVVEHSFNIHSDKVGGELRYFFREDENPRSKMLASARNDANFEDGRDKKYIRNVLKFDLSPSSISSATQVIVLGPNWQQAPWLEVEEYEHPEKWEQPVLLVLPNLPANLHSDLGKWLKDHVPVKRNTIRFLLPKPSLAPLYRDPDVYINSRADLLAQEWKTRSYQDAGRDFNRQLHKTLENRFERFAVLETWDYQQPANCRFTVIPLNAKIAGIAQSVDKILHDQHFDTEMFEALVRSLAAKMEHVEVLLQDLREPPPPVTPPTHALVYLGEGAIAEQLIYMVVAGKLALRPRGEEWVKRLADESEHMAQRRIKSLLYKQGRELAEMTLALPTQVGEYAAGPTPSVTQAQPVHTYQFPEAPPTPQNKSEELRDLWNRPEEEYPSSSVSPLASEFPPQSRVEEAASISYYTAPFVSDATPAHIAPTKRRSEPMTPLKLVTQLEKWEVSANATLPSARLEFIGISVADLKRVLAKLPATPRPVLEIELDEG
jgi:energy-coupling factor transporter ATP-binding protein EcfA2